MAGIDRPVAIVLSLDDDVGTVLAQTPAGTTIVFRDGRGAYQCYDPIRTCSQ